jgi:hypothetical protein
MSSQRLQSVSAQDPAYVTINTTTDASLTFTPTESSRARAKKST